MDPSVPPSDPSSPVVSQERIRQELIRRASEGCEGPLDEACFRRPKMPMHIWCDPCRCNEAIKALDAATEAREKLRSALAGLVGAIDRAELEAMEAAVRMMSAPVDDKARSIDAIHALLATEKP